MLCSLLLVSKKSRSEVEPGTVSAARPVGGTAMATRGHVSLDRSDKGCDKQEADSRATTTLARRLPIS